jgi:hypothetical protein
MLRGEGEGEGGGGGGGEGLKQESNKRQQQRRREESPYIPVRRHGRVVREPPSVVSIHHLEPLAQVQRHAVAGGAAHGACAQL